jgi:hypothetical protein
MPHEKSKKDFNLTINNKACKIKFLVLKVYLLNSRLLLKIYHIMKRSVIIFVLAIGIASVIKAQEYKTGIGVRLGTSSGLTIKHFTGPASAIEGLFTTRWDDFSFTGLYEINARAFDVDHLTWFYGGGGHLGFYNGNHTNSYAVLGVDGIIGLEYTFDEVPINLGIDFKPTLDLIGYVDFWPEAAFSVRYVF